MGTTDITGRTFGRLTAIERIVDIAAIRVCSDIPRTWWRCLCACGTTAVIMRQHLIAGNTRSCGCLRRENARRAGRQRVDRIARNGVSSLDKGSIQAQNGNRPGAGNTEATVSETIRSVCTPSDGTPEAPVVFENHAAGQAGGMPI